MGAASDDIDSRKINQIIDAFRFVGREINEMGMR
jgi:hypothetical protein